MIGVVDKPVGTATLETGAMLDKTGRPVVPAMELMIEVAGAGTPREVRFGVLEVPRIGSRAGLADAKERPEAIRAANRNCIVDQLKYLTLNVYGRRILGNKSWSVYI